MRSSLVAACILGVAAFASMHGRGVHDAVAAAPPTFVLPVNAPKLAPRFMHEERSEQATKFTPIAKRVPAGRNPVATLPGGPAAVVTTCAINGLKFRWPLDGAGGNAWVINNYTDLDPSGGKKDFKNAAGESAITYDGHKGYDIDVGSFREMDHDKVIARAAADGDVVGLDVSHEDRHTTCSGDWNYVAIKHANGYVSYYGHLKKNSAKVKAGDHVPAGQALAVVGSSGCSSTPHLHFEVHDCENEWVEPAKHGMWNALPQQGEVSGVLDVMLRAGDALQGAEIKDPVPNPTTIKKGSKLGIGLSAASKAGDDFTIGVFRPGGGPDTKWSWAPGGRYGHSFPSWDVNVGDTLGTLHVVIWVNGALKDTRAVTIVP